MKKITLLFFFMVLSTSFSQIPNWSWAKNVNKYFTASGDFTAVDNVGNVYLVGDFTEPSITFQGVTLTNTSANYSDMYVFKFTSTGDLLWARSFGGTGYDYISSITTDTAGNFYIAGGFQESIAFGTISLNAGTLQNGTYFAKFNSDGNPVWAKKNNTGDSYYINNLRTDATGNVYLAGYFNTPMVTFGTVALTYEYYSATNNGPRTMVVKLDANGEAIWARAGQSSSETVFGNMASSVAVDNAGGVAISGRFNNNTVSFGSLTLTKTTTYTHSSNLYIVKYDSNGTVQWGYNAGSTYENNTHSNAMVADANNNIIISGFFTNTMNLAGTSLTSPSGSQFFTAKFNSAGVLQWAKTPVASSTYSGIHSVDVDVAGNVYCAGMTFSSGINFGNGVALSNQGNNSLFVVRYNANGTAAWARSALGLNANNPISINVRAENEMYIAGLFDTATLNFGSTILTKMSTNYDLYLARLFYQPLSNSLFDADTASFYPNPTNGIVHFDNLSQPYTYSLFTTLGQCIKTGTFTATNETLDISGLQSGIYVMQLSDAMGYSSSSKIVRE